MMLLTMLILLMMILTLLILLRNLPADIKVTGWAPAPRLDFSARYSGKYYSGKEPTKPITILTRFDCNSRTYHYHFPRGSMDLDRMESAGQRLLGTHDFRSH